MAILTLLTDFGLLDGYVGIMKGVIWGIAPAVQIADLSHAILVRIVNRHAKNQSSGFEFINRSDDYTCITVNIVAEYQSNFVVVDKIAGYYELVGYPLRVVFDRVPDVNTEPLPVAEQRIKLVSVTGIDNNHDIRYSNIHQHRKRIIDHRLVIDR